LIDLTIGLLV